MADNNLLSSFDNRYININYIDLFIELFDKFVHLNDYKIINNYSQTIITTKNSKDVLKQIFLRHYFEFIVIYNFIIDKHILHTQPFLFDNKLSISNDIHNNFNDIKKETNALLKNIDLMYTNNNVCNHSTPIGLFQNNSCLDNFSKHVWYNYVFKWYDNANIYTQQICPVITSIVNRYDNIAAAFISILEPFSYLKPHKGSSKAVVRYLFPINIPNDKENCYMIINGEKHIWTENIPIIFDDTVEHSSINNTDEYRAVLFLDIIRSFNNTDMNDMNNYFIQLSQYFEHNREINIKINTYNNCISNNIIL